MSATRSGATRLSAPHVDTVLINGSVGTGKTTTAEALGEALQLRGVPGAVIDVDQLRRAWPAPPGDRFLTELTLQNLRAVASNYRRAGAQRLVVAGVVETPDQLRRFAKALGARALLHVRLTLEETVGLARLAVRHQDNDVALAWHARRHPELAQVLGGAGFTDELVIDTTRASPSDIAGRLLDVLGD